MRFAHRFADSQTGEWKQHSLDYKGLKRLLPSRFPSRQSLRSPFADGNDSDSSQASSWSSGFQGRSSRRNSSSSIGAGTGYSDGDNADRSNVSSADDDHRQFLDGLARGVRQVSAFADQQALDLHHNLRLLATAVQRAVARRGDLAPLSRQARALGVQCTALDQFLHLNHEALLRLVRKHDRACPSAPALWPLYGGREELLVLAASYQRQLHGQLRTVFAEIYAAAPDGSDDLGTAVTAAAAVVAVPNSRASGSGGPASRPQALARQTQKYWVRREDVPHVRQYLLQHLPLLLRRFPAATAHSARAAAAAGKPLAAPLSHGGNSGACGNGSSSSSNSSSVPNRTQQQREPHTAGSRLVHALSRADSRSSLDRTEVQNLEIRHTLYLDNARMDCYHGRLYMHPNAQVMRLKWAGSSSGGGCATAQLECKVYKEGWKGESNTVQAVLLPSEQLEPFLRGAPHPDWFTAAGARQLAGPVSRNARAGSGGGSTGGGSGGRSSTSGAGPQEPMFPGVTVAGVSLMRALPLLLAMQQTVVAKQLQPVLHTIVHRETFQMPFDRSVRVCLTHNCEMRVYEAQPHQPPPDTDANGGSGDSTPLYQNYHHLPAAGTSAGGPAAAAARAALWRALVEDGVDPPDGFSMLLPYAVLKVNTALPPGQELPLFLRELLASGYLIEVADFSSYVHGCALLLPDLVKAVPYWVDDPLVTRSMQAQLVTQAAQRAASAAAATAATAATPAAAPVAVASPWRGGQTPHRRDSLDRSGSWDSGGWEGSFDGLLSATLMPAHLSEAQQLLQLQQQQQQQQHAGRRSSSLGPARGAHEEVLLQPPLRRSVSSVQQQQRQRQQQGEQQQPHVTLARWLSPAKGSRRQATAADGVGSSGPGLTPPMMLLECRHFFESESMLLNWLRMALMLSCMALVLLSVSAYAPIDPMLPHTHPAVVPVSALIMLTGAVLLAAYAARSFVWRSRQIADVRVQRMDDRTGPLWIAATFALAFSAIFAMNIADMLHELRRHKHHRPA